ncbi:hypothetical protein B0H16DRAFT_1470399 [Mycena metata]|uniref:Uncharacterized protein n=1 Tax=Mycena metata TaxID=1033252 RepID=A0AAD7HW37_9AGAR|nr:hypothetical protein B0H16DRAFT_1470399 [Mycena metata]
MASAMIARGGPCAVIYAVQRKMGSFCSLPFPTNSTPPAFCPALCAFLTDFVDPGLKLPVRFQGWIIREAEVGAALAIGRAWSFSGPLDPSPRPFKFQAFRALQNHGSQSILSLQSYPSSFKSLPLQNAKSLTRQIKSASYACVHRFVQGLGLKHASKNPISQASSPSAAAITGCEVPPRQRLLPQPIKWSRFNSVVIKIQGLGLKHASKIMNVQHNFASLFPWCCILSVILAHYLAYGLGSADGDSQHEEYLDRLLSWDRPMLILNMKKIWAAYWARPSELGSADVDPQHEEYLDSLLNWRRLILTSYTLP